MDEISMKILLHAGLGDIGSLCFLWVLVEIINAREEGLKRARIVSMIGFLGILSSWIVGGYYYVVTYGSQVKPVIIASDFKWAHSIFMETKEHVFLFLPILACLVWLVLQSTKSWKGMTDRGRRAMGTISFLIFLIGFSMALMGFIIAVGARAGLAAGVTLP